MDEFEQTETRDLGLLSWMEAMAIVTDDPDEFVVIITEATGRTLPPLYEARRAWYAFRGQEAPPEPWNEAPASMF